VHDTAAALAIEVELDWRSGKQPMTKSYAVIFDVDGVLVDSYHAHFASWQRMAGEQGWTVTEAEFAASFGRTSREIIAQRWSNGRLSDEQVAELDDRKEAIYREILRESFPAMDGAARLIVALADSGVAMAVGSSGPPQNVQLVLENVDFGRRIQAVVTGVDVTRGKPDPQVFRFAAERLGVAPARCVVVEDAPAGIAAARAAGMHSVGLVSTGRTAEELQAADLVVTSLQSLSPSTIRQLIDGPE
jgi:beta-phosphoglucomutase